MGSFSWYTADTLKSIRACNPFKVYVITPDNTMLAEPAYDGYGHFAGYDIYELVADWNRAYFASHPDDMLYLGDGKYSAVGSMPWYPYYADLSLTPADIVARYKANMNNTSFEYRFIGIDLACYDRGNMSIPYPIKIVQKKKKGLKYDDVRPSLRSNCLNYANRSNFLSREEADSIYQACRQ